MEVRVFLCLQIRQMSVPLYLWKQKLEWLLPPLRHKGRKQKTWDFTESHHTGCVCTTIERPTNIYGTVARSGRTSLSRLKEPRQNLETRIRLRNGWEGLRGLDLVPEQP